MIRRKNIQMQEEMVERGEASRERLQTRKETTRNGTRFSYKLDCYNDDGDCNDSRGKANRLQDYETSNAAKQSTLQKAQQKSTKYQGLKKDYLYEDNSMDMQQCKASLRRSRNQALRFEKNNTTLLTLERQDIKNTSFQYPPPPNLKNSLIANTTFYNRTALYGQISNSTFKAEEQQRNCIKNESLGTEEDLQLKYQELWANNQRQKQKSIAQDSRYELRQPLAQNNSFASRQNIIVNTRNIMQKNLRPEKERSLSLRSEQVRQSGSSTHRLYNQVLNSKVEIANCLQTRKTSPTHFRNSRVHNVNEQKTLRCSPAKMSLLPLPNPYSMPIPNYLPPSYLPPHLSSSQPPNSMSDQIQVNLRLIQEFTCRVSSKIDQLTMTLSGLRLLK